MFIWLPSPSGKVSIHHGDWRMGLFDPFRLILLLRMIHTETSSAQALSLSDGHRNRERSYFFYSYFDNGSWNTRKTNTKVIKLIATGFA